MHKHPQNLHQNPQKDGKCPGVWAFLRSTKRPKENAPKNWRASPLRITFKNQQKQAECAPPLPPPHPKGDTESTQHVDDYKENTPQNLLAFLPKNKISKIKKIRQSACSQRKMRPPPPIQFKKNARACFPTGGLSSKTYIYNIFTFVSNLLDHSLAPRNSSCIILLYFNNIE